MDPIHDPSPGCAGPLAPGGELVVLTGRQTGTRRPLGSPLTFLGRGAGCDVRLNVDGVHPLHCVIAHGPAGLLLRDLDSPHGTLVNGQRVTTWSLREGDLVGVGPFQFRVHLPTAAAAPNGGADDDATRAEKEALRIQAAAVAAQQAALAEAEERLRQRRGTLEQQEGQLAAHLEEKRRRLLQLAEHAQTARAALQKERTDYDKHIEKVTSDLGQAQRELLDSQQQTQAERQRLLDLRKRMKQRWHRHWMAERATMRRREEELAAARRALEKDGERFQQERAALGQARLRFNGEAELGKRQLQADRDAVRQQRQRSDEHCARARDELARRDAALAEREAALADGQRRLADETYRWEKARGLLIRETEGLDTRIRNQRRKVIDQQQEIVQLEARLRGLQAADAAAPRKVPVPVVVVTGPAVVTESGGVTDPAAPAVLTGAAIPVTIVTVVPPEGAPTDSVPAPAPPEPAEPLPTVAAVPEPVATSAAEEPAPSADAATGEAQAATDAAVADQLARIQESERAVECRAAALLRFAETLADQRLLLAEQWERLAQIHRAWHEDRQAAHAQLEALAADLPACEEVLVARRRAAEAAEADARRRHQEAAHVRHHLEGWSARLRIREAGWESERDRVVTDARSRELLAEKHLAALVELRRRWAKRRRQELEIVRAERAACERLRQECATLRQDLWRRSTSLEEERRTLAERTLALEQYRQELAVKTGDSAAAERRVERLRRKWVGQNANLVRATAAERQALREEIARLEDSQAAVNKQMEALAVREAHLMQRQTAWEEAQTLADSQQGKLQQELQSMQAQRDRYALHLMELQDEVERIARVLLEESEAPLHPASKAA